MTDNVVPFEKPEPSDKDKAAMGIPANAIKLTDTEQMGRLVTGWHATVIQDIHHKLQMPADVGIDIPTGEFNEDGTEVVIDGNEDHKAGFLAGLNYALEQLDTFPVKGVPDDGEDA